MKKLKSFPIFKLNKPKVVKTIDPKYNHAKKMLQGLTLETENALNKLRTYIQLFTLFTRNVIKLAEDYYCWSQDGTQRLKANSKCLIVFARNFDSNFANEFIPQIEEFVLDPLQKYVNSVLEARALKKKRAEARRKFDELNSELNQALNSADNILERKAKAESAFQVYTELNTKFISMVTKICEQSVQAHSSATNCLISIFSNFWTKTTNELKAVNEVYSAIPKYVFH